MLENILEELSKDSDFNRQVAHWERIPAKKGDYREFPQDLHPSLREILIKRGISALYSHQAESYKLVREGKNVVIVTPTASGKTLSYNLPILNSLLEEPESRALYLFPTKALSQDQQSELNEVVLGGEVPVKVATYDGDTPVSVRQAARDAGRIIISNPDMMHAGIMPNHPKWIKFFSNCKYIVIDEVHSYRGVFGSHMINLIRRMKRICAFYDAHPIFILCSATIGNPGTLAESILEMPVEIIDQNGAPSGEKHIILYNPPVVDAVQGIRRGVVNESQSMALRFLRKGIKTIVFSRSRVRTELIAAYINKTLENIFTENEHITVEPYRGGYLPNERRAIEKGLRDGHILGVVSTNALELGIDIGGLDVAILAGFPGSLASTWQQSGRAGRSSDISLALVIASSAPVDQYLVQHPEYLFESNPESAFVDPDNIYILTDHVKCAVFELPFQQGEKFGGDIQEVLDYLEEGGVVRRTRGRYFWSDRGYPAEEISLRSSSPENVVIINTSKGKHEVIGEMDWRGAMEMLYDQAIYIHRGDQYVVTHLDLENQRAYVEETQVNYYTDTITKTDIKVLEVDSEVRNPGFGLTLSDVLVRTQVAKFKKLKYHTHENIGYGDIHLPEDEMHTRALVLRFFPGSISERIFTQIPEEAREAMLSKLGTLLRQVAPVFLLCDPRDVAVSERLRDPHFSEPALYFYDRYPGGIGLSEALEKKIVPVLEAGLERITACPCDSGCPSCIGPETGDKRILINIKPVVKNFLEEVCREIQA
jgi:DEAD/DEAH box helicase domain-containing protein